MGLGIEVDCHKCGCLLDKCTDQEPMELERHVQVCSVTGCNITVSVQCTGQYAHSPTLTVWSPAVRLHDGFMASSAGPLGYLKL